MCYCNTRKFAKPSLQQIFSLVCYTCISICICTECTYRVISNGNEEKLSVCEELGYPVRELGPITCLYNLSILMPLDCVSHYLES
jgi:hypothetical protein